MDDRPASAATAAARARLAAIETAYSDAEHDLGIVLTQPSLFDPAFPLTARFRSAHELARQRVAKDPDSWTAQQSVDDLESSWQFLRGEARRVGVSGFSWWQRLRIRRAGRCSSRREVTKARRGCGWPCTSGAFSC